MVLRVLDHWLRALLKPSTGTALPLSGRPGASDPRDAGPPFDPLRRPCARPIHAVTRSSWRGAACRRLGLFSSAGSTSANRSTERPVLVFCTLGGRPLTTAYVRAMLPRLARRAGIEKRVHAHGMRHSFASGLAQEGVPMNVIQAALGHSSLATTSRYLAHVAPQQVIDTLRARSW